MKSSGGSGRQTALILLMAIIAARLLLNGRMQTAWYYLWHGTAPLGSESTILALVTLGGAASSQGQTLTADTPPSTIDTFTTPSPSTTPSSSGGSSGGEVARPSGFPGNILGGIGGVLKL